ncbi:MAG: hypothetical protein QM726_12180 [Chitinophagaceae bacterium]
MEPSFLAWYLKKNVLHEQAWDKWIDSNPLHATLAEEASEVLAVLVNLEVQPVSNYQRNVSFNRLLQKIAEKEKKTLTTEA